MPRAGGRERREQVVGAGAEHGIPRADNFAGPQSSAAHQRCPRNIVRGDRDHPVQEQESTSGRRASGALHPVSMEAGPLSSLESEF